jgi:hypothetical protein
MAMTTVTLFFSAAVIGMVILTRAKGVRARRAPIAVRRRNGERERRAMSGDPSG